MKSVTMSPTRTFRLLLHSGGSFQNRTNGRLLVSDGLHCEPCRQISSGEVFTALKPFFFAVHPDLFGQFPRERAVNENSLKQLNAYIESASHERPLQPTRLTFYLRKNGRIEISPSSPPPPPGAEKFESVRIDLGHKDVRRTVHSILEKCNLPTSYVDNLPQPTCLQQSVFHNVWRNEDSTERNGSNETWSGFKEYKYAERDIASKKASQDGLESWLKKNVEAALKKLHECWPIREEIVKLKKNLSESLHLRDVVWDCGWGTRHFRGCLQSFQALAAHHPESMEILRGRTIVFGRETGVSLDGHVILNSGEVRANWHDLIKNVKKHDALILRTPSVEKALSRALKDISVVHRKFEPVRLAEVYETHVRKLATSVGDYRGRRTFPTTWPESLSHLELVVETDAGPLMVSPTGQIIVPSSCPGFLLVNFITDHMEEASRKLDQYKKQKYEEKDLHAKCVKDLGLIALQKDDNVTPDLMISCCRRLAERSSEFAPLLQGTQLWVTTYYSVLSDGELCIPWNWKDDA